MDRWIKLVAVAALIWILVVAIAPALENPVSPFRALRMALATMLMLILLPLSAAAFGLRQPTPIRHGDFEHRPSLIPSCRLSDLLCTRIC
jgi:hypothetical protein